MLGSNPGLLRLRHWQSDALTTRAILQKSTYSSVADPDPGSGMGRKSASGSGIRDEQPGSYFLELSNYFFGLLKFLDADPGSGMEKSWIRDEHHGSAKLTYRILSSSAVLILPM